MAEAAKLRRGRAPAPTKSAAPLSSRRTPRAAAAVARAKTATAMEVSSEDDEDDDGETEPRQRTRPRRGHRQASESSEEESEASGVVAYKCDGKLRVTTACHPLPLVLHSPALASRVAPSASTKCPLTRPLAVRSIPPPPPPHSSRLTHPTHSQSLLSVMRTYSAHCSRRFFYC